MLEPTVEEYLHGTGNVWLDGSPILAGVKYVVRVEEGEIKFGQLELYPLTVGMRLMMMQIESDKPLVLHLQNGLKWDCTLKNSSGELTGAPAGETL